LIRERVSRHAKDGTGPTLPGLPRFDKERHAEHHYTFAVGHRSLAFSEIRGVRAYPVAALSMVVNEKGACNEHAPSRENSVQQKKGCIFIIANFGPKDNKRFFDERRLNQIFTPSYGVPRWYHENGIGLLGSSSTLTSTGILFLSDRMVFDA
jgi:hypothetical protein